FFRHQFQIVIARTQTVLYLRTPSNGRGPDGIVVSMHQRAQTLFSGLITRRVQLLLGKRHCTLSHSSRGVDLDQVGACLLLLSDVGPDLLGRPCLLASSAEWFNRRQNSWAREYAFPKNIAQGNTKR